MGKTRHSQEDAEQLFLLHGYTLIDTYVNTKKKMCCVDTNGYQYLSTYDLMLRGRNPLKFHVSNPYSINNINKYFELNNYTLTLLDKNYVSNLAAMHFRCECGKVFESKWDYILQGKRYCNDCAKFKKNITRKDFTSDIIKLFQEKNYTLITNCINSSDEYFEYVCNKHRDKGIQKSTYNRMTSHHSFCRFCAIEARLGHRTRTDEKIKELVENKGFIYVDNYYRKTVKSDNLMVGFICPNHANKGVQYKSYTNFTKSKGKCKYCRGYNRSKDEVQAILDKMHGTITVLQYKDFNTPVLVKCNKCGYEWSTSCNSLMSGRQCPRRHKSYFSIMVSKILDKWGYNYSIEYTFPECKDRLTLPFDFYLMDFNILIEADGEGHYIPIRFGSISKEKAQEGLEKTQMHDMIKTEYCRNNGIHLIRIPYWEQDNLEYFLWDELAKFGAIEK